MTLAAAAATIPDDLSKLEAQAAEVLSPEALAYILAGAGDADSTCANAAAFRRWKIKRRRGPWFRTASRGVCPSGSRV